MNTFLQNINSEPQNNSFENTIFIIEENYTFTPSEFKNGDLVNAENQNNGSCKIFSFAQLHNLTEQQTLHCFGDYYRKDVLENPQGADHQNIRNFMQSGWAGIAFSNPALREK